MNIIAGMLYITIVTLLIASNDISRIQAQEEGEQEAQLIDPRWLGLKIMNSVNRDKGSGTPLAPVVVQNGNTFIVPPGGPKVFGIYSKQIIDGHRLDGSEYQQAQQNGDVIRYGPVVVQKNNKYIKSKDSRNNFGWPTHQSNYVFPDTNAQTEKKAQNNTNSQAQVANSSNLQLSLSFEKFYIYLYTSMILYKYYLF